MHRLLKSDCGRRDLLRVFIILVAVSLYWGVFGFLMAKHF